MIAEAETQLIRTEGDVVAARQIGRKLAEEIGFSRADQALTATAISELTRNIVAFAGEGVLECRKLEVNARIGMRIRAKDQGPGIPDVTAAMTDGFSTSGSLGLGLPGTERIVDEFDIRSRPGQGVVVTLVKWLDR